MTMMLQELMREQPMPALTAVQQLQLDQLRRQQAKLMAQQQQAAAILLMTQQQQAPHAVQLLQQQEQVLGIQAAPVAAAGSGISAGFAAQPMVGLR